MFVGEQAGVACVATSSNTFIGEQAGSAVTSGENNTIIGGYNGNQNSLDIRTSSNNIVLSDGDGTPDVTDYFPFNPFKTTDDWGQNVETYPELFVAPDISELNKNGLQADLNLAVKYFGKFEWEWWAVGQGIDAMLELANAWCDRRLERGQLWYYEQVRSDLNRLKLICLSQTAHPHASLNWKTDSSNSTFFTNDMSTFEGWMEQ